MRVSGEGLQRGPDIMKPEPLSITQLAVIGALASRGRALATDGARCREKHAVDLLVADGYRVRVADNLSSSRLENLAQHKGEPRVDVVVGDFKDKETRLKADADVVLQRLARSPRVGMSITEPEARSRQKR